MASSLSNQNSKVRLLLRLILGLVILFIIAGGAFLSWKFIIQPRQNPDIVLNAPEKKTSTSSPTTSQKNNGGDFQFEAMPYRNKTENFQINVPLGWEIDDSGTSGPSVILFDPQTTIAEDKAILTYIHVSVSKASGQTLTGYVNEAKVGLQAAYKSYVIDDDRELLRQGITYHLIGGSYQVQGTKMMNRNLFLVYKNKGYAISATAPESSWKNLELLINATLFSFKNI